MSITSAGSALGAVLHPIMLNKLFDSSIGFHNGVRISAGLNTFLYIVALLLMRTRLPPRPPQVYPFAKWVKEPAYVCILVGSIFVFLGLFYPVFFLQLQAFSHGVNKDVAFYSLPILNAASLFGRMFAGAIAAKAGPLNTTAIFVIGTSAIEFVMISVKNTVSTIMFALFYGFFSGGAISMTPPVVALLSKDISEIGGRLSLVFIIGGVLGLFANSIAGAILGPHHDRFTAASVYSGVCLWGAATSYIVARMIVSKRTGKQIV